VSCAGGVQSPTKDELQAAISAAQQKLKQQQQEHDEFKKHYWFMVDKNKDLKSKFNDLQAVFNTTMPVDAEGESRD
jgi:hypothetical protein